MCVGRLAVFSLYSCTVRVQLRLGHNVITGTGTGDEHGKVLDHVMALEHVNLKHKEREGGD